MYEKEYPELQYVKKWYDRMMNIQEVNSIMQEFEKNIESKRTFFKSVKPPTIKPSL
jgi:hypothetical protein